MANFNPYQFTNVRYSPDYSQYGDGLFAPFGSQIFSQDSQPSTSTSSLQPSFDRAFEHRQPIQPSPVPSAASGEAKKSNQRERWSFADEKVLLQLWADNIEKVESKDSRKAWEEICKALNERQGLKKNVDQCQRKVKHLKNQYKEKKDWNRRQSGGNLRKSPNYDIIDSVLGCRDIIMCNNVEQAGTQAAENSGSSANSPETSAAEASSSSSSAGRTTPTTAGSSVARRRERKKVKGQKRPARVHDSDSEDDTIGEAIKKLATEGEQMASFMERMQDSQGQQIQLMSQLVGCFNKYMENNKKE